MEEQLTLEGKIVIYLPSIYAAGFDFPTMNGGSIKKAAYAHEIHGLSTSEMDMILPHINSLHSTEEHGRMEFKFYKVRINCSPERYMQRVKRTMRMISKVYRNCDLLFIKEYGNRSLYQLKNSIFDYKLEKVGKE